MALTPEKKAEIVAGVIEHAKKPYCYEHGWDVIVECWTAEDIEKALGYCTTVDSAIRKIYTEHVKPLYSYSKEIASTAF